MASSTAATTPARIQSLGLAVGLLFLTPAAVRAASSEPVYTQSAEGFVSATRERAFVETWKYSTDCRITAPTLLSRIAKTT